MKISHSHFHFIFFLNAYRFVCKITPRPLGEYFPWRLLPDEFFPTLENLVRVDDRVVYMHYYCYYRECILANQQNRTPISNKKEAPSGANREISSTSSNMWLMLMHLNHHLLMFLIWKRICWFSQYFSLKIVFDSAHLLLLARWPLLLFFVPSWCWI